MDPLFPAPATEDAPLALALAELTSSVWALTPDARRAWRLLTDTLEQAEQVPCRTGTPEAWDGHGAEADHADMAHRICRHCPAREPCREYALISREQWGIWGGTTPEDRRHVLGYAVTGEGSR